MDNKQNDSKILKSKYVPTAEFFSQIIDSLQAFYKINLSKGSHNRYVSEDKIPRFQESNTTI